MKTEHRFLIWGVIIGLCLITVSLLIKNSNMRNEIAQTESDNRSLMLSCASQDPAYKMYMARYPRATCVIESGSAKWTQIEKLNGHMFALILEFNPRSGTQLSQSEIVTTNQSIYATKKVMSLDEFNAIIKKEPNNQQHPYSESRSGPPQG